MLSAQPSDIITTLAAERDKLRAENDRMRLVYEAVAAWCEGDDPNDLDGIIDAYRAAQDRVPIQSLTDERDKLRAEVNAMRPVVDASVRVAELDEICDAHPGINDAIGRQAESELYDAVRARTAAVDAYRADRDKAGEDVSAAEIPLWAASAIRKLHDMVDQADPNDPIGVALTRAGLERRP